MEDEIERRLEKIEKIINDQKNEYETHGNKLNQLEKSIDRSYSYPNYIMTAIAVAVILVGLFSALTLESEKKRLIEIETKMREEITNARKDLENGITKSRKDLKSEITAAFEKGKELPEVVLLKDIDTPLEGQTVFAKKEPPNKKGNKFRLKVPLIFKNVGKGTSEDIFTKLYFKKDLQVGNISSTDEKEFAYETYFEPGKWPFQPAVIPAGVSINFLAGFDVKNYDEKADKFPALIKIYFGGETIYQAKFYIKIL